MKSHPVNLSIIVPVYNVVQYLEQCITSILAQNYQNFEVIVVDDGSTDGSAALVDNFAEIDGRVKVIHKVNGGYGSAVNTGFQASTGKYIGIVESDDYIDSHMYASLIEAAETFQADIARCGFTSFDELGKIENTPTLGAEKPPFDIKSYPIFLGTPPAVWSAIYRRKLLLENGVEMVDHPQLSFQDVDFFVRTTLIAEKIVCIPDCLYFYRVSSVNSSSNSRDKINDIFFNYALTDQFVTRHPGISEEIVDYYNKRKVCDIQWHFGRISKRNKIRFARKASAFIKGIPFRATYALLDGQQRIFFLAIRFAPWLYGLYRAWLRPFFVRK